MAVRPEIHVEISDVGNIDDNFVQLALIVGEATQAFASADTFSAAYLAEFLWTVSNVGNVTPSPHALFRLFANEWARKRGPLGGLRPARAALKYGSRAEPEFIQKANFATGAEGDRVKLAGVNHKTRFVITSGILPRTLGHNY